MKQKAKREKKRRYEKPKGKKEFLEPEMKKGQKFNEIISSCGCSNCGCSACW